MLEARQLVLNRFDTFEVIHIVCSSIEARKERTIVIQPEKSFGGSAVRRVARGIKARFLS